MNFVLAGRSTGAVLARSQGGAAQWWMAAGVTPIAAYAPKGAASLAASYVNLANPGTYNAAPGVAPTWDAATGWTFNGSTQYLTTGIVPASGWTMIVRYSNSTNAGSVCGQFTLGARFFIVPNQSGIVVYGSGGFATVAPGLTSGVLAIAGQQGYRNGTAEGGAISAWTTTAGIAVTIGARVPAPISYFAGKIQSIWIGNTTLDAAAVATQSAAML